MMSRFLRRIPPLLLGAIALLWPSGSAADISLPTGPTVQVFPVAVEVEAGGTVDVPLTGSVRTDQPIEFLIRTPPSHGTLGPVRQVSRNRAVVRYTHKGGIIEDTFRYAGRTGSLAVSPSSLVRIVVKRPPDPIEPLPDFLDYGPHFAGDVWMESVTLTANQRRSVQLEADPPWRIEGPTALTLTPGRPVVVQILFEPTTQQTYFGHFRVLGSDLPMMRLHGEALDPFAVDKRAIEIPADPTAEGGPLFIANISGEDREVEIETTENLKAPASLAVPAEGEHRVPFRYTATPGQAGTGRITLRHGAWSLPIEVRIDPGPARWEWESATQIDLGRINPSSEQEIVVEIRNAGGSSGAIGLTSESPALLLPPERIAMDPGDSRTFVVRLDPARLSEGRFDARLSLHNVEGPLKDPPPLLLRGEVATAHSTPSPLPIAQATPSFARPDHPRDRRALALVAAELEPVDFPDFDLREPAPGIVVEEPIAFDAALPAVREIVQRSFLPNGRDYRLSWNAPEGGPFGYAVDLLYLKRLSRTRSVLTWWPIENLDFQEKGRVVETVLHDLTPGQFYQFRVRAITGDGRSGRPSPVLKVLTPLQERPPLLGWLMAGLALLGASALAWRKWPRKAAPREAILATHLPPG